MTLILTLGNADQVIQVSDRRLSVNGRLQEDEAGKAATLLCSDARLACGFTGLARYGDFDTRLWLLNALHDCAAPEYKAQPLIERLTTRLDEEVKHNRTLQQLGEDQRQITVMLSGYLTLESPPVAGYCIVTNHPNYKTHGADSRTQGDFECTFWRETSPRRDDFCMIQRVGAHPAMERADEDAFESLLRERRPSEAIVQAAVSRIHRMADRKRAHGVIGKQLSAICIPRDFGAPVETDYFTGVNTRTVYTPDYICAISDRVRTIFAGGSITTSINEPAAAPAKVPPVHKNRPCPCGSGKKYKRCHGAK